MSRRKDEQKNVPSSRSGATVRPSVRSHVPQIMLVALVLAGFLFVPTALGSEPTEPAVARVYFADQTDLSRLTGRLDIWEVNHEDGYVVALLSPAEQRHLAEAGYTVVIDREKTAQLDRELQPAPNQTSGVPGYACYRTLDETYSDMADLADAHPDLVRWVDIGDSWDLVTSGEPDGDDIYALELTNRAMSGPKPTFFLMAAIHAREMATAEIATRFAEALVAGYGSDPDTTWLLDHYALHVVPMANPDGRRWAEQGELWRKNTNDTDGCTKFPDYGVDLNRNSSFKWNGCAGAGCSSDDACYPTYRGSAPASEPETESIEDYVTTLFPDRRGPEDDDPAPSDTEGLFITLHSFGNWILFPWGWSPEPAPNETQLETLGRKFGYFTSYEVCQSGEPGCIYPTDGTTDDWSYGTLGLASYTFEVGSAFFESCSSFEATVLPDTLAALNYAFKATRRPYVAPAGPETLEVSVGTTAVAAGDPITLTAVADDTRSFSGGWGEEPKQSIAAARYSVDVPPWEAATTVPLQPVDGAFDSTVESLHTSIDTSGWQTGRHLIFVQSRDADGTWGVPGAAFVTVTEARHGVAVTPAHSYRFQRPAETVTHTLTVTNTGSMSDTFSVTHAGSPWPTTAPALIGPLEGATAANVPVTVTVPSTVTAGTRTSATVTIASQTEVTARVTTTVTTTAAWHQWLFPIFR